MAASSGCMKLLPTGTDVAEKAPFSFKALALAFAMLNHPRLGADSSIGSAARALWLTNIQATDFTKQVLEYLLLTWWGARPWCTHGEVYPRHGARESESKRTRARASERRITLLCVILFQGTNSHTNTQTHKHTNTQTHQHTHSHEHIRLHALQAVRPQHTHTNKCVSYTGHLAVILETIMISEKTDKRVQVR